MSTPRSDHTDHDLFVLGAVFLTFFVMLGWDLLFGLPGWVLWVSQPLVFIGGMAYEQEKCDRDGPIERQSRT